MICMNWSSMLATLSQDCRSFNCYINTSLIAQASNLDWLAKESPSKDSYQKCCENSFEKHREARYGGKNCTFFAKKLITHSFE